MAYFNLHFSARTHKNLSHAVLQAKIRICDPSNTKRYCLPERRSFKVEEACNVVSELVKVTQYLTKNKKSCSGLFLGD